MRRLAVLLLVPLLLGNSFPPDAGFAHAQTSSRTSIVVEDDGNAQVTRGMDYWNERAGWNLLVYGPAPEITVRPGGVGMCCIATSQWSSDPPYDSCVIRYRRGYPTWRTFAHEIGHCLGIADHPPHSIMRNENSRRAREHDVELLREGRYIE